MSFENIPLTLHKLLHRDIQEFDSSIPFLVFKFHSITHLLSPTPYHLPLSKNTEKLHKEIFRLRDLGLGYSRIHKELVKNGFKIGKSRTTVDSIIRKRLKRDEFFNQKVVEEYSDFDIHFYQVQS